MKIEKEWLSTKEALQFLKDNEIDITRQGLNYLKTHASGVIFKIQGFYFLYNRNSLYDFIKQRKNIPDPKVWIKINDLAVELHVHVSRIYRKGKEYTVDGYKHIGITYVNRPQFIKKYKEEYNENTDRRKEARN